LGEQKVLIAVGGTSGLGEVAGIAADHPTALLEVLKERPSSHVLLLTPWYAEAMAREQAHVAIAAQPKVRISVAAFRHHTFTLTLLGAVLVERRGVPGGWTDPGGAIQLLRQAAAESRSLVWHPRVLRMPDPQPTIGQRLRSVFGAPGFFGDLDATGVTAGESGITTRPDEVLCCAGEPPALLRRQLEQLPCAVVDVRTEGPRPYGQRATVELTGLVRPSRVPLAYARCSSCSAQLVGGGCVFCGSGPRVAFNAIKESPAVGAGRRSYRNESDAA
jgi:hypothetical protein